jgi:hypothetical protein
LQGNRYFGAVARLLVTGMEATLDAAMTEERRDDMRRLRYDAEQRRPLSATAAERFNRRMVHLQKAVKRFRFSSWRVSIS